MLPKHSRIPDPYSTDQTGLNLLSQTCAATLEFILYQKHIPGSTVSQQHSDIRHAPQGPIRGAEHRLICISAPRGEQAVHEESYSCRVMDVKSGAAQSLMGKYGRKNSINAA